MDSMGIWDIAGGPQYDIVEMVIFRNNRDGTFGSPIQVPSINLVTVRYNYKTRQTTGNGRVTYVYSQIESLTVTFRNFSINQQIAGLIMNADSYLYGATPNRHRRMTSGNNRQKYFGIAAKCLAGDEGDTHFMVPYMMVDQAFEWSFQYNDFVQPQIQATAVGDPVLVDNRGRPLFIDTLENETEMDLEVPFPAYSEFGSFVE